MGELVVILAIALLVFGAGKLPQVGASLGKAIRDFRRATNGLDEEAKAESLPPPPAREGVSDEAAKSAKS